MMTKHTNERVGTAHRSILVSTGVLLGVLVLATSTAHAHFLWVDVVTTADGQQKACAYFSEAPEPGSAELLDRIESAKVWWLSGDKQAALELTTHINDEDETGAWQAPLPQSGPCSLAANCVYGVFSRGEQVVLLNYYARHIHGWSPVSNLESTSPEPAPLDIIPHNDGEQLVCTVLWHGEPLAGAEVIVVGTDGDDTTLTTDDRGQVDVTDLASQHTALRVLHAEPDRAGEYDGQSYSGKWHVATLTMAQAVGDLTEADVSAMQLLTQARASRAVWTDFPGFSAQLQVKRNDRQASGTIRVDAKGGVELEGMGDITSGFPEQQIDSLIMHRMPVSQFNEEAVYEASARSHVLGTAVRLAEERMGSVYRIRDNVITEVNRNMEPLRFTISVLDVVRNEEGHYLPHVFTVSFWDQEKNLLHSNHTYYHEWQRIGSYDLPSKLVIVSSDSTSRDVLEMRFEDIALLKGEPAALSQAE